MNSTELKKLQSPLKEQYKKDFQSAFITLKAEGDLDFRGTLGVSKEVPIGFKEIRLQFFIDSGASSEQLDTLLTLTERYCVVYQTLKNGGNISTDMKIL